ncbi:MAG: family 20 glycosylhydrolase [Candidatus Marinimicrobia bacterium]|nr:family 20 glycosylhydrolase [bacterium]MCG2716322.1 family 20 glycosylhydrolase [Candidatus Neomarinimicrobiota bacterium]
MPMPEKIVLKEGQFRLESNFTINIVGGSADLLFKGVSRVLTRLSGRTGLFLVYPSPFREEEDDAISMTIKAGRAGKLVLDEDESYTLIISPAKIELSAETDIGILRGLETFLQLLDSDEDGYFFPAIKIEDKPRFPWRGLLIDACRHFIPVEVIKRNLDAMAAVKMNVLHWHLTEDQGFRIECKSFPKLHQLGSDGLYYTQEQIKDIVAYAGDRGIRIVPEFDLPGHATSWLVGYPELASAPGPYTIERNWGVFDPTFDPTRKETYEFLEKFFKEMATLFRDEFWHIGGDENNGRQWDANPQIQKFMKKNGLADNHALQNYFNSKIEKILDKLDKTMVGWYTDTQPVLAKKYVIQSWKGRKSLYESARNGYRCLLSHGFYIDLIQPTAYHYLNDPIPEDSILTESVEKLILGGEATMWAEFVGPETIDSRIWPRTAAIAERLWSPVYVNDVDDMFRRLDIVSFRLEELGLTHQINYDMMLRRLANNYNIDALKNFVDVIEPMYTYSRDHPHVFKSYYPLTRVVDAARPDPLVAREFDQLVDRFFAEKTDDIENLNAIAGWLNMWKANHTRLFQTIQFSPVLKEIETLSEDLSKCAAIGLEAIDYIKKRQKPGQDWIDAQLITLKNAQAPRGETELLVVKSIEKLVKEINQPGTTIFDR